MPGAAQRISQPRKERRFSLPPSSRRRMLSVLWIWPLSLLARACSNAVFPEMEQSVSHRTTG